MTTKLNLFLLAAAAVFLFPSDAAFAKNKKSSGAPVSWKEVPAVAKTTMETNAAGGKLKEVTKETVNGVVYYCGEVKGTDGKWSKVYVKESGEFVRSEPDTARNKRKHKPLFDL